MNSKILVTKQTVKQTEYIYNRLTLTLNVETPKL